MKPGETTKNLCGAADGGELSVHFSSFLCCPKAISCCFQQRFDRKGSTSDENVVAKKDTLGTAAGQRACGSSACIHIHANVCAVVTTGVPIRGWACACDTHFYGDRCQFGCVPVRETAVLARFYTTNDRFAKTGSGQTYETLRKKGCVSSAGQELQRPRSVRFGLRHLRLQHELFRRGLLGAQNAFLEQSLCIRIETITMPRQARDKHRKS
eukprot:COSAG06_NODE_1811_length_8317_cov_7.969944_4_plen_211_part_00